MVPAEVVSAAIEVKPAVSKRAIEEATKSIASARSLQEGTSAHILGVLFVYKPGYKRSRTFIKRWEENQTLLPHRHRINLLCVLGKGIDAGPSVVEQPW